MVMSSLAYHTVWCHSHSPDLQKRTTALHQNAIIVIPIGEQLFVDKLLFETLLSLSHLLTIHTYYLVNKVLWWYRKIVQVKDNSWLEGLVSSVYSLCTMLCTHRN